MSKLDQILQIRLTKEQACVLRERASQDERAVSAFARLLLARALEREPCKLAHPFLCRDRRATNLTRVE